MLTPREELETHTKPHTFIHTHTQSTTQNPIICQNSRISIDRIFLQLSNRMRNEQDNEKKDLKK